MLLVSSSSGLCAIYWSQVFSREWRCSWSSAERRRSHCIWMINNIIAHWGATYIRGLTVYIVLVPDDLYDIKTTYPDPEIHIIKTESCRPFYLNEILIPERSEIVDHFILMRFLYQKDDSFILKWHPDLQTSCCDLTKSHNMTYQVISQASLASERRRYKSKVSSHWLRRSCQVRPMPWLKIKMRWDSRKIVLSPQWEFLYWQDGIFIWI